MPESAKLKINEVDKSFTVAEPLKGIKAVSLQTEMGPFGLGDEVIRSWEQFRLLYGGETTDGAIQARRALDRGTQLRVNKIGHYTDVADPDTLTAVKGALDDGTTGFAEVATGVSAFDLILKYPGAAYNNVDVLINPASNGDANYFDLDIIFNGKVGLDEHYPNLTIPGTPTDEDSEYLDQVKLRSRLFDVVYNDLSAQTAPLRPSDGQWSITGGTNGGAVVAADYVGDPDGNTGFSAFGAYDDFYEIASLDMFDSAVHEAGEDYANARKDVIYLAYLSDDLVTASALIAERKSTAIDSSNVEFWQGGLKVRDKNQNIIEIPGIGAILGASAYTDFNYGEWWSKAGAQRGLIPGAIGVINNFGSSGKAADLNALANHQINSIINRDGKTMLWGNFTGQLASSNKSYASIKKLSIYIRKALRPTCEKYLEEPNDPQTWKTLYQEVFPFLEGLKSKEKRALFDYSWQGDQMANSLDDLVINNKIDVQQGIYKVDLAITEINSMQQFTINIISTNAGITLSDNL